MIALSFNLPRMDGEGNNVGMFHVDSLDDMVHPSFACSVRRPQERNLFHVARACDRRTKEEEQWLLAFLQQRESSLKKQQISKRVDAEELFTFISRRGQDRAPVIAGTAAGNEGIDMGYAVGGDLSEELCSSFAGSCLILENKKFTVLPLGRGGECRGLRRIASCADDSGVITGEVDFGKAQCDAAVGTCNENCRHDNGVLFLR